MKKNLHRDLFLMELLLYKVQIQARAGAGAGAGAGAETMYKGGAENEPEPKINNFSSATLLYF